VHEFESRVMCIDENEEVFFISLSLGYSLNIVVFYLNLFRPQIEWLLFYFV
jgi:hypothetical protein